MVFTHGRKFLPPVPPLTFKDPLNDNQEPGISTSNPLRILVNALIATLKQKAERSGTYLLHAQNRFPRECHFCNVRIRPRLQYCLQ